MYDAPGDHGTSHTSIVDKDGMAVSITTSISRIFGSGIMEPETGVILNDEVCFKVIHESSEFDSCPDVRLLRSWDA